MSETPYGNWQPVIGLEIHVQLNTHSKLFSPAPNRFGDEPNLNISDVCTAQPGTLPVLNRAAVWKAVRFGCAVKADISLFSRFDRKSYFYPDSPRNFQITQFEEPILKKGAVTAPVEGELKTFQISHAHLEDDAGMLKHFTNFAGVDFNRAGAPLLEIVSEPCMHTPKEASAYAAAIKAIMLYIDASDCNMEEGSLRVDCNISIRPKGETELRTKIEIKNLNSFSTMEEAIDSEIRRQIALYTKEPQTQLRSGTYRYDLEKKETVLMRLKEAAEDYRYFPEPDLPPIVLSQEAIDEVRKTLPELPHERALRYREKLELPASTIELFINDKQLADYFEEALKTKAAARLLSNWIIVEFVGRFKESGKNLLTSGILPAHIGKLVQLIEAGTITGKIAKSIADEMCAAPGKDPSEIVSSNPDYLPIDISSIEPLVDQVIAANPQSILDYKAGKGRAFDFLVGQVMKLCKGKASPAVVNELLAKKLKDAG